MRSKLVLDCITYGYLMWPAEKQYVGVWVAFTPLLYT